MVSYSSSPAFEVIYAETPLDEPPTAAVTADNTCFRQIEFVGILKGTQEVELARKWVDFMLSVPFQEDVPMQMFVFPVNPSGKPGRTPSSGICKLQRRPLRWTRKQIAANRDQWLKEWTETVLR